MKRSSDTSIDVGTKVKQCLISESCIDTSYLSRSVKIKNDVENSIEFMDDFFRDGADTHDQITGLLRSIVKYSECGNIKGFLQPLETKLDYESFEVKVPNEYGFNLVDLSQMDLKTRVYPELYLSDELVVAVEIYKYWIAKYTVNSIYRIRENKNDYDMKSLSVMCHGLVDIKDSFHFFFKLGKKLDDIYIETNKFQIPLFHEGKFECVNVGVKYSIDPCNIFWNVANQEFIYGENTQELRYKLGKAYIDLIKQQSYLSLNLNSHTHHKEIKKFKPLLLKALSFFLDGVVDVNKTPSFIGYVPTSIATKSVCENLFRDSPWTLNLVHGEFSHLLQIADLVFRGKVNKDTLPELANCIHKIEDMDETTFWELILDRNIFTLERTVIPFEGRVLLLDKTPQSSGNSPINFNLLLCTGSISNSLKDIKDKISQIEEQDEQKFHYGKLETLLGVENLDENILNEMVVYISKLEYVLASIMLRSARKINKAEQVEFDGMEIEPYKESGSFRVLRKDDLLRKITTYKVKKELDKGRRMIGINKDLNEIDLTTSSDLNEFIGFIRLREDVLHTC